MSKTISIRINQLGLIFNKESVIIPFTDVTYFYGQMGAGKSSIARLIDYCLGGDLDLSPAMQLEFVSANLVLIVNGTIVRIQRTRDSEQVLCSWKNNQSEFDVILPARKSGGIVIPDTEVEVLSDFIFWLAGMKPPRVRKSKIKDATTLERLSLRDLLWYCYLDQDTIDNDFFHLGDDANPFKRLKSKDVLRFMLGFHQEEVAELESDLQFLHLKKLQLLETVKSLETILDELGASNVTDLEIRIYEHEEQLAIIDSQLNESTTNRNNIPHATELLKNNARYLQHEIDALEDTIPQIKKIIDQDTRHKNELKMLGLKVHRVASARAVLSGVEFESCPRCAQKLPSRSELECRVCGQEEKQTNDLISSETIEQDARNRIVELEESISLHNSQLKRIVRRLEDLKVEKRKIDDELNNQLREYDSAYLSSSLVLERQKAVLKQQIANIQSLIVLPKKLNEVKADLGDTLQKEIQTRADLERARKGAESDLSNLKRLESLFLDSLVKAKLPGISLSNVVKISPTDFLPEVFDPLNGDFAVTSFANLHSGGKKTLFKACFAIALHRLAIEIGAFLPNFLIIDSPMKNISERENRLQFEGFHDLLYRLSQNEFKETQIIIIDKEFCEPSEDIEINLHVRHMMPDSDEHPPLITYHRGF